MNNNTATIRMTKQDLAKAKFLLTQRNEKTRINGYEAEMCDPAFRSYYHPGSPTGRQILASYTNDELLDFLISYMQHRGHSPDWEKIHHVYKLYLTCRFGDLAQAKAKARSRQKALTQQSKWPPDWPVRVSSEPFYRWLDECGKTCTDEDKEIIETLCADARQSGLPPDLSTEKCKQLGKFCDIKKALEMMNIPPLNKAELRFMARYWNENRTK